MLPLVLLFAVATAPAQQIPLPAFASTYTAPQSRGFWFQAPVDFVITGLRVPDESGTGLQHVEVVDFGVTAPATFPATTVGSQLFRATAQPAGNVLPVTIPVTAGRFIGVLGGCGSTTLAASQAAAGTFASSVLGVPITLTRLGSPASIQAVTVAPPCWSEAAGPIGRVEVLVAPAPNYAYASSFGSGCYDVSRSWYEQFLPPSSFDLVGRSIQAIPDGGGYLFVPGPAFVPPTGSAVPLTLGDDTEVVVPLTTSFPFVGGAIGALVVCSNGFVSLSTGNGTGYQPDPSAWLNSAQPRWGMVHDFNPTIAGSGPVRFEELGGVAYVTWDNVYDHAVAGVTTGNTFQLQFDTNSGSVTCVWGAITGLGNGSLVGFAAGGNPARDLGELDVSVALATGWSVGAVDLWSPVHTASARPRLGTAISLDTTQIDATSLAGVTVLGLNVFPGGISLDGIGMANCQAWVSPDVLLSFVPAGGVASQPFPVPLAPSLSGFTLASQALTLVPGVNAFGAMSSNGLRLVLGAN